MAPFFGTITFFGIITFLFGIFWNHNFLVASAASYDFVWNYNFFGNHNLLVASAASYGSFFGTITLFWNQNF